MPGNLQSGSLSLLNAFDSNPKITALSLCKPHSPGHREYKTQQAGRFRRLGTRARRSLFRSVRFFVCFGSMETLELCGFLLAHATFKKKKRKKKWQASDKTRPGPSPDSSAIRSLVAWLEQWEVWRGEARSFIKWGHSIFFRFFLNNVVAWREGMPSGIREETQQEVI